MNDLNSIQKLKIVLKDTVENNDLQRIQRNLFKNWASV